MDEPIDMGEVRADSSDTADVVRARVADVLKSDVERELTVGGLEMAGHSRVDHVVEQVFDPNEVAKDDSELLSRWDDERFEEFTKRLTELRETPATEDVGV
jgi:hypothetical protein